MWYLASWNVAKCTRVLYQIPGEDALKCQELQAVSERQDLDECTFTL